MKKIGLLPAFILFLLFLTIGSCSDSSVTDFESTGFQSTTTTIPTANAPATITLAVTPSSGLSASGTATVAATVRDSANVVVQDGTTVSFSVANTALGTITPTATTVSGIATATFTAENAAGVATVLVTAGGITTTTNITILGVDVGSIQFVSATPNVIGVKGSGQTENSIVTFSVKDINGQLAADGTNVTFALDGPKGGESLNPATASTVNGLASTTLQSGSVAGPVRVNATTIVSSTPISSSSTGVSIGGGAPSMTHFTLARTVGNLAGLSYVNLQSTISAFLADRFGNFNVLQGTSISFYTEAGAVDRSAVTNTVGATSVTFRTQDPTPLVFSAAAPYAALSPASSGDPINGLSTIIAVTRGEECFIDSNGNGVFDGTSVDSFPGGCDIGEPFVDEDDDGNFDATEFYLDANQNGVYSGPNGAWDGNILIWKKIQVVFSGGPTQITTFPATFAILAGQSQSFATCIADSNGNSIMAGSSVAITTDKGTLAGETAVTFADLTSGRSCIIYTLTSDTDPPVAPATVPTFAANITIKVTWKVPGVGDDVRTRIISGTIE